jgi:hypothetical protein
MRCTAKILLLIIVWNTSSFGVKRSLKRSPAFDSLVAHIATENVAAKPSAPPLATNSTYITSIQRLNALSIIYFFLRLITYDAVRSTHLGKVVNGKENYILRKLYITQTSLYKLATVTMETLILKTIIKCAIYISQHDALDGMVDLVKKLFRIILSI